jgi:hypothetical protein
VAVATVECFIDTSPSEVFAVLADGWTYSNWVVGTSHMRAVGEDWPAVGSKLHHASGIWPLALRDESVVLDVAPDQNLTLAVRVRPIGEAKVVLELAAEASGTRVTMHEYPIKGPGRWFHNPVSEALLVRRNVETLARLAAIAEGRIRPLK